LTREWLLVSPHRARRPWQGQVEKPPLENLPAYDPGCYLCPGNTRVNGEKNPDYQGVYTFENDFPPLLLPDAEQEQAMSSSDGLFRAQSAAGVCRVICYSPRHDLTLPELSEGEVEAVVRAWRDQTEELAGMDFVDYVQVFENRGAMMGCSNPHPHNQIWSVNHVPSEPYKEMQAQVEHYHTHDACLLCQYVQAEQARGERIVAANEHFMALVPFWAIWPFEVMLIATRHVGRLADLAEDELRGLADILRQVTIRYDNLFEVSFPYSMGFHQRPFGGYAPFSAAELDAAWHLHAHFYPPLLRSATVRKFMVGYELLASAQRDLTPETAAERLRSLPAEHYKAR
ncbi:MAG TPA: UDP-glucose--hexose-1-phosphate uridylyltransferase, partial [Anaerolineales bacterium]|nr:UDP-glucose--hexose-1-phosphate uridylyltransferase [Anaerolineales bacterium]